MQLTVQASELQEELVLGPFAGASAVRLFLPCGPLLLAIWLRCAAYVSLGPLGHPIPPPGWVRGVEEHTGQLKGAIQKSFSVSF